MKNYCQLSKSYQMDRKLLSDRFSNLISKMISYQTDLHHYFETVTNEIHQIGSQLELYNDLRNTSFSIDHVNLFVCKAHKIGGLHIDSAGDPRFVSINIPLDDGDRSKIVWVNPAQYQLGGYDLRDKTIRAGHPANGALSINEWEIIDQVDFSHPMIIRVNHWHSVDNRFNPNPRIALAIRLNSNPSFEDVVKEFQHQHLIGGG